MNNEKWAIVIYHDNGSEVFDFDATAYASIDVTVGEAIRWREAMAIRYAKSCIGVDDITWVSVCSGPYDAAIEEPEDAVNIETCDPIFVYESEDSDD